MQTEITCHNFEDADGAPSGGSAYGPGFAISWQCGPLGRGADRDEPNGAFVEGIIEAAMNRIRFYQSAAGGRFACRENANALVDLTSALEHLEARTKRREASGIEGTHEEDPS